MEEFWFGEHTSARMRRRARRVEVGTAVGVLGRGKAPGSVRMRRCHRQSPNAWERDGVERGPHCGCRWKLELIDIAVWGVGLVREVLCISNLNLLLLFVFLQSGECLC